MLQVIAKHEFVNFARAPASKPLGAFDVLLTRCPHDDTLSPAGAVHDDHVLTLDAQSRCVALEQVGSFVQGHRVENQWCLSSQGIHGNSGRTAGKNGGRGPDPDNSPRLSKRGSPSSMQQVDKSSRAVDRLLHQLQKDRDAIVKARALGRGCRLLGQELCNARSCRYCQKPRPKLSC